MAANVFIKGTEIKFSIDLTAKGFSMDDDDFDVEVLSTRGSVSGSKGGTSTDLTIFHENSDSSDSSGDEGAWYVLVKTDSLGIGELKVKATAHIPDASAFDGVRNEIASASLGTLQNA